MAQTEAELLDNPVEGNPTLILRSPDFHSITEVVAETVERPTPIGWWFFFIPSLALLGLLGVAVSWLFWEGIGVWGLNVPVGWACGNLSTNPCKTPIRQRFGFELRRPFARVPSRQPHGERRPGCR